MQYSLSHSLRSRSLLDSDVAAFAAESGATNLSGLNTLARYVKAEGLWDNFVIYPMMSSMNAGSGSTVYGLGGLTTNDMTLVNSPTWGTGGIEFNGLTQYASASDFLAGGSLNTFSRVIPDSATPPSIDGLSGQDNGGVSRGFYTIALTNGTVRVLHSADGSNIGAFDTAAGTYAAADTCWVTSFVDGSVPTVWADKTSKSLSLFAGSQQSTIVDSSVDVLTGASLSSGSPTNHFDGTKVADCFITGTLTTTKRETITDLINAL